MEPDPAFDMDMQTYSVHRLLPEDIPLVQSLCGKCLDYMLVVDGHPADPVEVEKEFYFVPSGISPKNKFVFGILDQEHELVGMLDAVCGYPEEGTWWIGLLMFVPEVRSQGIGRNVLEGFAGYVRVHGGQVLMLGVVEENKRAYEFWKRTGFEFVRLTEPRPFGDKTQRVNLLRRVLVG